MCGIVGVISLRSPAVEPATLERMCAAIRHRGPDDQGIYRKGPVGFGFRRLSILDLSDRGHQPMESPDGNYVIVFNGEIYNYIELREELQALGHQFRSTGDTEVLLHAYIEWGPECPRRLNGMWAFLVYDRPRKKLFGCRDRFGVKPLYLFQDQDHVVIGSEIKAIRASGLCSATVDWTVATNFLLEGRLDDSPNSFFTTIKQVPAATAFEVDLDGAYRSWPYWSLTDFDAAHQSDPATSFRELFEDSVRLRLRSDVPVGVFLSGGLDSTSIICSLARQRRVEVTDGSPPKAFSYMSKEFDERRYIEDTVAQTGAELRPVSSSPRALFDSLPRVLWHHDEPVHTLTALVGFALARLAADEGVRVILNGQGADETAAGYASYFPHYWVSLLTAGRLLSLWHEISVNAGEFGGGTARLFGQSVRRLLQSQLRRAPSYRHLAAQRRRQRLRSLSWFPPALTEHLDEVEGHYQDQRLNAALRRAVECDPLPLYLRVEDRNAMAHSVEVRVPFLDYRLVQFLFETRGTEKMRGALNKYILREAMRGLIPQSVYTRVDKMGFPHGGRSWIAGPLYDAVRDIVSSQAARERGIYNIGSILKDLERHRAGQIDVTDSLFRVVQFEVWNEAVLGATSQPTEPSA